LTRILIAQDQHLVADAMAVALRGAGYDADVAAGTTPAIVRADAEHRHPDLAILGIELRRGVADGLGLITALKAIGSAVIVFAEPVAATLRAACLEAGADGILTLSADLRTLFRFVERALAGEPLLEARERAAILCDAAAHVRRDCQTQASFSALSLRERQVLLALMSGQSAAQIAAESFVCLATVRSHIQMLLTKLGVSSQVAAVAVALEADWPDRRGRHPALQYSLSVA